MKNMMVLCKRRKKHDGGDYYIVYTEQECMKVQSAVCPLPTRAVEGQRAAARDQGGARQPAPLADQHPPRGRPERRRRRQGGLPPGRRRPFR